MKKPKYSECGSQELEECYQSFTQANLKNLRSVGYKKEFTSEPVPRKAKNCADLLLQGSNNSHILLGTEKFVLPAEFPGDEND